MSSLARLSCLTHALFSSLCLDQISRADPEPIQTPSDSCLKNLSGNPSEALPEPLQNLYRTKATQTELHLGWKRAGSKLALAEEVLSLIWDLNHFRGQVYFLSNVCSAARWGGAPVIPMEAAYCGIWHKQNAAERTLWWPPHSEGYTKTQQTQCLYSNH